MLSVQRGYWEGGTTVVIDPFATPVVPHTNDSPLGPTAARWSTDSATMCGYGTYGGLTSLSTAHEPEWLFSDAIADFTTYDAGPPQVERNVTECAWLDPNRVAFLANIARYDRGPVPQRSVQLFLFDVKSGALDPITEFTGGVQISAAALLALPNATLLAQQLIDQEGNGGFQPAQPQIVDVSTGAQAPVLAAGQRVVAILSP